MKLVSECIPCTYKVCLSALNAAKSDDRRKIELLGRLGAFLAERETDTTPGIYHSEALHFISGCIGVADPFKDAKRDSDIMAMGCLDHLAGLIKGAEDPLLTAVKISAAGNIVDMGILPDFDLDAEIDRIPSYEFHIDSYAEFLRALEKEGSVLIIGDNSGEIAFDMLLVKELKKLGKEVVYAVKGGPVLNDATMEDASRVGMTEVCKVIANGSNLLGTYFECCSAEFLDEFRKAGVVISKGQANYETLEDDAAACEKTFFLMRIKCGIVGGNAGAPLGSPVFIKISR